MRALLLTSAAFACTALAGCVNGRIYTHIIEPLDINLRDSAIGEGTASSDSKDFNYSYVRIVWGSYGVVDAAKAAGMEEVYFADLETLSILGIWTQRWIHVYGR
ncbi:MAG TPA: hypothetical protein ENI87_00735 [bacterium]|nr:hypothetical protein [bacterium]